MRDALDFRFAVAHRVHGIALAGWPFGLAGLAEVNSAQKLAHDQNVSSVDHLGAKRRTIFQSREANRRAQIREYPQLTAKTQQPPPDEDEPESCRMKVPRQRPTGRRPKKGRPVMCR